eukprot:m.169123 g.169123  ORF g.169123 m.169123 type:complete len:836 (+) comp17798_c2_seq3:203-2710(+)
MTAEDGDDEWAERLDSELQQESPDGEAVRLLVMGHALPHGAVRSRVWKILLGVDNKPDALANQAEHVSEHDCPVKQDCLAQAARYSDDPVRVQQLATEMEVVLNFVCRARGVEYQSQTGWAELLVPFVAQAELPRSDCYNCLYSLVNRFGFKASGQDAMQFSVFRLLLLYHDPELCTFLDSRRLGPSRYAGSWFRSLFAATCGPDVTWPLWDAYLQAGEPFLVFFLALVMLVNARDVVFSLGDDPDGIAAMLETMPGELTPDDVQDMCQLAYHYASVTPQAFRTQFVTKLFGNAQRASDADSATGPQHTLCLHVPVENAVRSRDEAFKYFVVDCRPLDQYDAGHLPQAWHLDALLMLEQPQFFEADLERLASALEASASHPTFLGSGREEEDQYLRMVVSRLLQRYRKHVSILQGGFAALHSLLDSQAATTATLDGHSPADCLVCLEAEAEVGLSTSMSSPKPSPRREWLSAKLTSFGATLREKTASIKESSAGFRERLAEKTKEVKKALAEKAETIRAPRDAQDSLYRAQERSMFAIDDEDDEEEEQQAHKGSAAGGGADLDLAGAIIKRKNQDDVCVNIDLVPEQPAVLHCFQCSELLPDGYLCAGYLVLTPTHVIKLRERNMASGEAYIMSRRAYSSLVKLSAKKKHPTLLTFVFEDPAGTILKPKRSSASVSTPTTTSSSASAPAPAPGTNEPEPADTEKQADPEQPAAAGNSEQDTEANSRQGAETGGEGDQGEADSAEGEPSSASGSGEQGEGAIDATEATAAAATETTGTAAAKATGAQEAPSASSADPPSDATSSDPLANLLCVKERFLIPEADTAKAALRKLIASQ